MTNNHNVLITMLRRGFKFLDHLAHSRYDEDVYEPLDDAMVYENEKDRNIVHIVFEDFPWVLDNPCVHLVEFYLDSVPHHIAIMEIDTGVLEVEENFLEGDNAFLEKFIPSLDGEFWRFERLPMSCEEIIM